MVQGHFKLKTRDGEDTFLKKKTQEHKVLVRCYGSYGRRIFLNGETEAKKKGGKGTKTIIDDASKSTPLKVVANDERLQIHTM
jgi:uncharacterized protein YciI